MRKKTEHRLSVRHRRNNMESTIFFNYTAAGYFISSIMGASIIVSLLRLKSKDRSTILLVIYHALLTLGFLSYGVATIVHSPASAYLTMISILFLPAGIVFLRFAYSFRENLFKKEARAVIWLCSIYSIFALTIWIFRTLNSPVHYDFTGNIFLFTTYKHNNQYTDLISVFPYLWAFVVLFRKAVFFLRKEGQGADQNQFILFRFFYYLKKILISKQRDVQSQRALLIMNGAPFIVACSYALSNLGLFSLDLFYLLLSFCSTLFIAYFTLNHINYLKKNSSIRLKISLIFLMLSLSVLNVATFQKEKIYENKMASSLLKKAIWLQIVNYRGRILFPSDISYIVERNKIQPSTNLTNFGNILYSQKRVLNLPRLLTNSKIHPLVYSKNRNVFYRYNKTGDLTQSYVGVNIAHGGKQYEMGFSYLETRKGKHSEALGFVIIALMLAFAAIVIIPIMLKNTVTKPMNNILHAVRRGRLNDYNYKIPVYINDEFGTISNFLNQIIEKAGTQLNKKLALLKESNNILAAEKQSRLKSERVVENFKSFTSESIKSNALLIEKYKLSQRELEVASKLAEGLSVREIGIKLFIAESTAKRHTLNIYKKLNVSSRLELIKKIMTFL